MRADLMADTDWPVHGFLYRRVSLPLFLALVLALVLLSFASSSAVQAQSDDWTTEPVSPVLSNQHVPLFDENTSFLVASADGNRLETRDLPRERLRQASW